MSSWQRSVLSCNTIGFRSPNQYSSLKESCLSKSELGDWKVWVDTGSSQILISRELERVNLLLNAWCPLSNLSRSLPCKLEILWWGKIFSCDKHVKLDRCTSVTCKVLASSCKRDKTLINWIYGSYQANTIRSRPWSSNLLKSTLDGVFGFPLFPKLITQLSSPGNISSSLFPAQYEPLQETTHIPVPVDISPGLFRFGISGDNFSSMNLVVELNNLVERETIGFDTEGFIGEWGKREMSDGVHYETRGFVTRNEGNLGEERDEWSVVR